MAFPYANYVFIPYTIFVLCYFMVKYYRARVAITLLETARIFKIFLILSLIFIVSYLFSEHNVMIIKEIAMMIILLAFVMILKIELKGLDEYRKFADSFMIQLVITSGMIAILGIVKYILVLSGRSIFLSDNADLNSSLNSDYNSFALSCILGIVSILYLIRDTNKSKIFYISSQILLFVSSVCLLFTGSRRGFVIYIFFLGFVFLLNVIRMIKPETKYPVLRLFFTLKISFFLIVIIYFATYNSNTLLKLKRSDLNVNFISHSFFGMASRYASVINVDRSSIEKIINIRRDPRFPYTRWGTRIHKEVFPLEGTNSEMIPAGSVGYKLDSTCNASTWNGNAYAYTSLRPLFSGNLSSDSNSRFFASVYCYVSPDYNGSRVWIGAEGKTKGSHIAIYDDQEKGKWQKLIINFSTIEKDLIPVYIYISKEGNTNFKNLSGYVIFAYPEYGYDKLLDTGNIVNVPIKVSQYWTSLMPGLELFKINDSHTEQQETLYQTDVLNEFVVEEGAEQTIPRSERIRYSYHLFFKEYSLTKKVLGDGFGYMKRFGSKFGSVELDYPHNPFISTFLYSGIIGGVIYIFFIVLAFYYYLKYLKYHYYFFTCFLIVFVFSFISANTHFSIPVFTFLSVIPFLINNLNEAHEKGS